jgi:hypothetical protein
MLATDIRINTIDQQGSSSAEPPTEPTILSQTKQSEPLETMTA